MISLDRYCLKDHFELKNTHTFSFSSIFIKFPKIERKTIQIFIMSDIAQILGVEDKPKEGAEEKKPKKSAKNDLYANLPRYLRNIVDENNPPPLELLKEKKS